MKILLVEDKSQLADAIQEYLKSAKIETDIALDGEAGSEMALSGTYDAIILDVMLPLKDGIAVLKDIRHAPLSTPVMMLSAKATTDDKVIALMDGADDYMTKPFALEELRARLIALTRRKGILLPDVLSFADVSLDRLNHTLGCGTKSVSLSLKEFQIFEILITTTDRIVEKPFILGRVWGGDSDSYYNSVEVYVSFLRHKLTAIDSQVIIKSVRSIGYKLLPGVLNGEIK
jgi:DNA-binding response OmpR family regulator